jgi:Uma2 family endonuclease
LVTKLYPDVFVTCDEQFSAFDPIFTKPVLIIEVLSPSTHRCERSEKFAIYRRLKSLQEYALIDPETRRIEVFRPVGDGCCLYLDMTEQGFLRLDSIDFEMTAAALFNGLTSDEAVIQ